MQDPDEWRDKGVHWHAYTEEASDDDPPLTRRHQRLKREPEKVLQNPDAVADWIGEMVQKHALRRTVRLIGAAGGSGHIADARHAEYDLYRNLDVACRGDSIYTDIERENGRLYVWVEAVTPPECTSTAECGGHEQERR